MENKIIEEIKEMAPTLCAIKRTNPFLVPDGYFELVTINRSGCSLQSLSRSIEK